MSRSIYRRVRAYNRCAGMGRDDWATVVNLDKLCRRLARHLDAGAILVVATRGDTITAGQYQTSGGQRYYAMIAGANRRSLATSPGELARLLCRTCHPATIYANVRRLDALGGGEE